MNARKSITNGLVIATLAFTPPLLVAEDDTGKLVRDAAKWMFDPRPSKGKEGLDGMIDYSKKRALGEDSGKSGKSTSNRKSSSKPARRTSPSRKGPTKNKPRPTTTLKRVTCHACRGKGCHVQTKAVQVRCSRCGGKGRVKTRTVNGGFFRLSTPVTFNGPCPKCNGSGSVTVRREVGRTTCSRCDGKGYLMVRQ